MSGNAKAPAEASRRPVDTDPDEVLERLRDSFVAVDSDHFRGAGEMAAPACDLLNGRVLKFGDEPGAKSRFEAACFAAFTTGDAAAFRALANGLEKFTNDNRVAEACFNAIECLDRVPSFAEVHQSLPGITAKTLQRRLRAIGVRLPQSGRNSGTPRAEM